MKILYECFSCSPYYGSDEEIGWKWPLLMSQYHEVWALVRSDRKEGIEKYCKEHNIQNIHFIYCDIPDRFNFYYKHKQKGKNKTLDFLAYQFLWQYSAFKKAKQLHETEHFDIVHHVTNDFRLIGHLAKLDTHFVLGPIGGGQKTPQGLLFYTRNHKSKELLRSFLNIFFVKLPGYKFALNKASRVYFSNKETMSFLLPYIKDKTKCFILTEVGVEATNENKKITNRNEIVFMWAGRMEYRKGLELLVDSLKRVPLDENWKLILCGDGPDKEYLQSLCINEEFKDRVHFIGRKSYEEVQELYNSSSVFVFPSLRETTGTVILEAMSHGLPVICLNQGGGALIVNEQTGFLIPVDNREICIEQFSNAMINCIKSPELIEKMGGNAQERVTLHYTWSEKIRKMESVYSVILDNNK